MTLLHLDDGIEDCGREPPSPNSRCYSRANALETRISRPRARSAVAQVEDDKAGILPDVASLHPGYKLRPAHGVARVERSETRDSPSGLQILPGWVRALRTAGAPLKQ